MSNLKFSLMILVSCLVFSLVVLLGTSIYLINPGNAGVLVSRTGSGVAPSPLGVGFHFAWPIVEEIYEYPVYMQTMILTKPSTEGSATNDEINVNSIEGQPISCDVSLSFELDPTKVPQLYSSFRSDIETIKSGFLKQAIRQSMQESVGKIEIVNFLGKEKAQIVADTQQDLQKRLEQYGFIVKQFTLNEIRAPQSIVTAIEAKNTMAQEALRAQNELQKKEFEAQQRVIEAEGEAKSTLTRAEAQAKSNRLIAESLTPNLVEYQKIVKWNGQVPQVQGGVTPLLNLK